MRSNVGCKSEFELFPPGICAIRMVVGGDAVALSPSDMYIKDVKGRSRSGSVRYWDDIFVCVIIYTSLASTNANWDISTNNKRKVTRFRDTAMAKFGRGRDASSAVGAT